MKTSTIQRVVFADCVFRKPQVPPTYRVVQEGGINLGLGRGGGNGHEGKNEHSGGLHSGNRGLESDGSVLQSSKSEMKVTIELRSLQ